MQAETAYFCENKTNNCMVKKLLIVLAAGAVMMSCGGEKEKLKSQVDSLKAELQTRQQFANTLQQVGTLMDSIDANRQLLRMNMVEGTTYEDYTSRMKDINNYVKDTQNKIEDLETALKKSKGNTNTFSALVKKLKSDLEEKGKEIAALQSSVEELKSTNQNLITTVGLQEAELTDKESQIQTKTQELSLIEAKVQEIMVQSKMSEGDSYYARAQAVEEAANRTKLVLAKRKKPSTTRWSLIKRSWLLETEKPNVKMM